MPANETLSQKIETSETITEPTIIWDLIDLKANEFKQNLSPQTDLAEIPVDFQSFYEAFIMDSIQQKDKIAFDKFIGVLGECDTTIRYNDLNWEYTNWNFIEYFPLNNNTNDRDGWNNYYYSGPDKFYYEFNLKEVGVIYQVGFKLIDSQWKLTLYFINAC